MTDDSPLVSIIMPAFDVERFVEDAVASARAQSYPRFELIAINDGSRDSTPAILARLARRWDAEGRAMSVIDRPNGGLAAARNTGLDAARGAYIAFLDADDRWRPELLAELVGMLRRDAGLELVFPRFGYIDESGAEIGAESRSRQARYDAEDLLVQNPIHSDSGVVVRAGAVRRAGRFDEPLEGCVGLDFWVRLAGARRGAIGCADRILAEYRRRDGQITADWRRMERSYARVISKTASSGALRLTGAAEREARARLNLYLSILAYADGDYADSRRLIATAWALAPLRIAGERQAYLRLGAGLASLLPAGAHERLRARFTAARRRLGLDLS